MNIYRTKDLSEAALLYASHKKLYELERDNHLIWFIFEDRTDCERLTKSFWRREALIDAKDYSDSLRTLKSLIFNKEKA